MQYQISYSVTLSWHWSNQSYPILIMRSAFMLWEESRKTGKASVKSTQCFTDGGVFVSLYSSFTLTCTYLAKSTGCRTAAPLLLTSSQVNWEAVLHSCGAIPILFILCHSNSISVISWQLYDEMRRGKPKPSPLLTQGIFNLPHYRHGMRATGL